MRDRDIEVGKVYAAKVNGRVVCVRVTEITHPERGIRRVPIMRLTALNLLTGRKLSLSPRRLRYRVGPIENNRSAGSHLEHNRLARSLANKEPQPCNA